MSNRVQDARELVIAQRRTGKLLQIGLQRRSNPRYIHAIDNVIKRHNVLGEITHGYAQWNRNVAPFLSVRSRLLMQTETLEKYGYETMEHFLNWRWFTKYGGGPMISLGPHQLDVFMWAFDCAPSSVMASGGNEYYDRQANDSVMAVYEFKTKEGKVKRVNYQVLSTTSRDGFYEQFMGIDGVLKVSELARFGNYAWPEFREDGPGIRGWMRHHQSGVFTGSPILEVGFTKYLCEKHMRITESRLSGNSTQQPHVPHLENYFRAVRHGTPLSSPAEVGYRATVAALAVNRAIKERKTIDFKPEDFEVKF